MFCLSTKLNYDILFYLINEFMRFDVNKHFLKLMWYWYILFIILCIYNVIKINI